MTPKEYQYLFIFLAIMVTSWGVLVVWRTSAHPTVPAIENDSLRSDMAVPKTDRPTQLTYAKDHEQEWLDANSGDRAKALPAWDKILTRFRLNVIGSGADAATEGLKDSEAWFGHITGDKDLDSRLIEAAVLTRIERDGTAWIELQKLLDNAASNDDISATLAKYKF
jgi:hypothetical protein